MSDRIVFAESLGPGDRLDGRLVLWVDCAHSTAVVHLEDDGVALFGWNEAIYASRIERHHEHE
jgi:hypothetical protein